MSLALAPGDKGVQGLGSLPQGDAPPRSYSGLDALIFGKEAKQRMRVQRSMMSALVYVVWMAVEVYCAQVGIIPWSYFGFFALFNMMGLSTFYVLLRSGYNLKMRDPNLTLEQVIYAVGAIIIAYMLLPPTRAAALQVLCLIQVFGMFTLSPRQTVQACVATVGLLLLTLALLWFLQPAGLDLRHETINVALSCLILPAITAITRHFATLREGLLAQRGELKQALARVHELATRDVLTNLVNRAHMQELASLEHSRHRRNGLPFCLALLDIDHFKRINDSHGHQVGDEVLQAFAAQMVAVLRQTDVVARWGGEEFLVLLPDTAADAALLALERLRLAVAASQPSVRVEDLRITVSAGLAQWREGDTLAQTIERADRALYVAKNSGRNRNQLAA